LINNYSGTLISLIKVFTSFQNNSNIFSKIQTFSPIQIHKCETEQNFAIIRFTFISACKLGFPASEFNTVIGLQPYYTPHRISLLTQCIINKQVNFWIILKAPPHRFETGLRKQNFNPVI